MSTELPWWYLALSAIIAYAVGSIPTAVWWGTAFFGTDVREHGSRNAGATNTFRVLGPKAGVPVLLIDIAKGFLPVRLLPEFSGLEPYSNAWVMFRVALVVITVIGHLYPVFADFRGGKGIATSLGGVLAVHPGGALICVGVFLAVFLASRYVSLGSLAAAVAFPIAVLLLFHERSAVLIAFSIVMCLLVFYTHRQNIGRLLRGTENRIAWAGRNPDGP
ncbi:MAG: glycerol-3-phosphate 1-O-acyltransferase PlsY [Flavobacteriales bacterium]|nr:glycerol-3-phosphate 1-O-acyltransferase PlsY [Flavobacteriales bacterium]MCB9168056.1 glycerol-3-phosphate 1-O-acyltransferase PlsY [Flavobacteriales bacterium]